MKRRRFVAACVLALLLCCMIMAFVEEVLAQDDDMRGSAQRTGLSGVFQRKKAEADDPRKPKAWQKWLGLGSIAVMIVVVKYL